MLSKPKYVFDKQKFSNIYRTLAENAEVYYPIKTNDSDFVVESLIELGSKFEVDTVEHVRRLIEDYHVSADSILFNAILRSSDELIAVSEFGVKYYALDSISTISCLNDIGDDFRYLLRLGISEIVSSRITIMKKWGVQFSRVSSFLQEAAKYPHALFEGYSFYLSDEGNTPEHRKIMIERMFAELDCTSISTINIGGSVPVDEMADYVGSIKKFGDYKIIVEPGRPLLNPCIDLIATVIDIKTWGRNKFVFTNVGIYNGMMDAIIKKRRFDLFLQGEHTSKTNMYMVSGPTGDLIDNIGTYSLPSDIAIGDTILIKACGAYCQVLITPFYCNESYDVQIISE